MIEQARGDQVFTKASRQVVEYLSCVTPIPEWSVSRVHDWTQTHVHVSAQDVLEPGEPLPMGDTFCRRMLDGAPTISPDSRQDPAYADLAMTETIGAYAGVPIDDGQGRLFGILCGVARDALSVEDVVDEGLLRFMSEMLTHQLVAARALDEAADVNAATELRASTDELTGLLNRRGWEQAVLTVQRAIDSYGDPVHVAMIDLDELKQVNDRDGHDAGDALLRRTATLLATEVGPRETLARYGGDEFVLLSVGRTAASFDRLVDALVAALGGGGVAASVGVAKARVAPDGLDVAVREADVAMYADKQVRRQRLAV